MNQTKKHYKRITCKICLSLSVAGLVLALSGCGDKAEAVYPEKSVYEPAGSTVTSTDTKVEEQGTVENVGGSSAGTGQTPEYVAPQVQDERVDDAIAIETAHCTLYFPVEHQDKFTVKFTETAGYKAEFYGVADGKKEVHLFDICFNSDDGELLGYFQNEDEIINISFAFAELDFSGKWSQEEKDLMYAMQEDMNFVIETLSKNANYVEP